MQYCPAAAAAAESVAAWHTRFSHTQCTQWRQAERDRDSIDRVKLSRRAFSLAFCRVIRRRAVAV